MHIIVIVHLWGGGDSLAPGQSARLQEYDPAPVAPPLTAVPDTRLRVICRYSGMAPENLSYGPVSYSEAGKHPIHVALKQD